MITFLTGAPGGGKTLYTVWNLLRKVIDTYVYEELDDGSRVEHKRIIYTNIRGLLLDHELVDYERLKTWHEWAQPGALLVVDECQKLFIPRPNGSAVPKYVSELEEHRGVYSVDFILISQHPMLIDRHVQGLVGRHLHLRRMAMLPLSLCYEFDMISRTLAFKIATSKSFVRFNKQAYKLYKSARVHTVQPKKIPGLVWVILAAVGLAAWKIPESYGRITGKNEAAKAAAAEKAGTPGMVTTVVHNPIPAKQADSGKAQPPPTPEKPLLDASGGSDLANLPANPVFAGCARVRDVCRCYDQAAQVMERPAAFCQAQTVAVVIPAAAPALGHVPDQLQEEHTRPDLDLIAWAARRR
jgi:zona occludens toxin